ncbi:actin organization and endocytosis protein, partial [Borealophlyctis nickersoniae]
MSFYGEFQQGFPAGQQQQQVQQTQNLAAHVTLPFIEQVELVSYENYFKQGGPSPSGLLSADSARNILVQSQLSDAILARIWSLSAITNGSSLTYPEFCLAMYLAKLARAGTMPPPQLPDAVRQQVLQSATAVSHLLTSPAPPASPLVPALSGNAPMSRSASFQVPLGVTVVDGFAGPMVVQAPERGAPMQQQQQQQPQRQRDWAIEAAEKARYDSIFKVWDPENSGFISGDRARQIFMQSGLADNILAHIWTLADTQKHGKLNPDEFAVAMHLVYKKLNGYDLPKTLPPELIPPSTRELDALASLAKNQLMSDILKTKQSGGTPPKGPSPWSSSSNLADPLGTFGSPQLSRGSVYQDRESAEQKRKELASQVEKQKRELASVKEATANANKTATELQIQVDRLMREVRDAQSDVKYTATSKDSVMDQIKARGGSSGRELEESRDLERDIKALLDDCRGMESRLAEEKTGVAKAKDLKRGGTGSVAPSTTTPAGGTDPQSKAAALLAARMAALGLSGPAPASSSSASASSGGASTLDADVARIEADRRKRTRELDDIAERVRILMDRVRAASGSSSSSGPVVNVRVWDPPVEDRLKYEQAVGVKSKEVRKVVEDLARVGGGTGGSGPSSGFERSSVGSSTAPRASVGSSEASSYLGSSSLGGGGSGQTSGFPYGTSASSPSGGFPYGTAASPSTGYPSSGPASQEIFGRGPAPTPPAPAAPAGPSTTSAFASSPSTSAGYSSSTVGSTYGRGPAPAPPAPLTPSASSFGHSTSTSSSSAVPPPPPPPAPGSTPISKSSSASSDLGSSLTNPFGKPAISPGSSSVDDVVAQAQAAIRAAKERVAQRQQGAGGMSPTGGSGTGTPVASTPVASSAANPFAAFSPPAKKVKNDSDPFGSLGTSTAKSDPFAFTPSSTVGGSAAAGGGAAGGEEDEVEAAMRRLRDQERALGISDFRKGAGTNSVGASVPAPVNNTTTTSSVSGPDGGSVVEGARSAFEVARQREAEALKKKAEGKRPPPPVPGRKGRDVAKLVPAKEGGKGVEAPPVPTREVEKWG